VRQRATDAADETAVIDMSGAVKATHPQGNAPSAGPADKDGDRQ
jgi:hypothetical protein